MVQYALPFALSNPNSGYYNPFGSGHKGYDFNTGVPATAGTPIPAIADGVVADKNTGTVFGWNYGHWVMINHADGKSSFYGHMAASSPLAVGSGVSRGTTVGGTGTTGASSGIHLHLGLVTTATSVWEDPIAYINAHIGEEMPTLTTSQRRTQPTPIVDTVATGTWMRLPRINDSTSVNIQGNVGNVYGLWDLETNLTVSGLFEGEVLNVRMALWLPSTGAVSNYYTSTIEGTASGVTIKQYSAKHSVATGYYVAIEVQASTTGVVVDSWGSRILTWP